MPTPPPPPTPPTLPTYTLPRALTQAEFNGGGTIRSDITFERTNKSHSESTSVVGILLAEDKLVNQMMTKTLLQSAGYNVAVAGNGLEALNQVKASYSSFSLVLMDIQMPVVSCGGCCDGSVCARVTVRVLVRGVCVLRCAVLLCFCVCWRCMCACTSVLAGAGAW